MFTRCPNCRKVQTVTLVQLRNNRAIAFCSYCATRFDALELLTETVNEATEAAPLIATLPWEKSRSTGNTGWLVGVLSAFLLLIGQVIYFEGYDLTQKVKFRPLLDKLCQRFSCHLPPYRQLDEISVLDGSLTPLPNHNYALKAVISNQALFEQHYPNLHLTLLDYSGQAFTYRLFKPEEYLSGAATAKQMAPDAKIAIHLEIAATQMPIGGYTFELTY